MKTPSGGRVSFRFRLIGATVALAVLGTAAAGSLAYLLERGRTDQRLTGSLGRSVEELRKYAGVEPAADGQPRSFRSVRELLQGAVHQSVNAEYECTLGFVTGQRAPFNVGGFCPRVTADPALLAVLAASPAAGPVVIRQLRTALGEYSYVVVPVTVVGDPQTGRYAVVMDRGGQQAEVTHSYLTGYAAVAVLSVVLITAVAWALAGQILRPLRLLVTTTRQITGSDVNRRVPVAGRDETAELSRSINSMLDAVEQAIVSERRLLNDVGHELRTPLTIVRGHLELTDPHDPDDFIATRTLVMDEIDRMHRLVDSLITLAKADGPDFAHLAPCELAPLLDEVLDKGRALGQRRWRIEEREEVSAVVDSQLLTQALLELISNAVKHSADGSEIALGLTKADGAARLTVRDQGSGIPAEELPRIFQRFSRAPGSERIEGAG
ncbi:MAG: HAMP domain-containing histidine kinase, partial [Propionibacteriaceae bacterium]|nr:HAMP domain-containing histidine kinase [Propionibacteriaceae bacterium]